MPFVENAFPAAHRGINTQRRSISELQPHWPHKYSPPALDGLKKSTRCIHSLSVLGNDEKPHALVASPEEIAASEPVTFFHPSPLVMAAPL
jgi:hypothetical protein